MNKSLGVAIVAALLLAACSSAPRIETANAPVESRDAGVQKPNRGGYLAGDGPGDHPPANIDAIPDAVPVDEPLHRFANRPYSALDQKYTPLTEAGNFKQRGIASWYGKKFHGQRTSSGEKYDMYMMTAAHPTLPIPSYARVTNVVTQKAVVVRINDRGPFLHNRAIDLSYTAAHKLGIVGNGSNEVEIESVTANSRPLARVDRVESRPIEPVNVASNGNIFLQLGAFNTRQAAENFLSEMRAKLGEAGRQLIVFNQNNKTRVHIGPYASLDDARSSREGLKEKLGFMPVVNLH